MPDALTEVEKPCKAGLSFSRSLSGILRAVIGSRDLFATGFAFAIVQASLPLFTRFARR